MVVLNMHAYFWGKAHVNLKTGASMHARYACNFSVGYTVLLHKKFLQAM